MYSVVIMMTLTAGSDTADFGRRGCNRCHGVRTCHGCYVAPACCGCSGSYVVGCSGCYGSGCYSPYACSGGVILPGGPMPVPVVPKSKDEMEDKGVPPKAKEETEDKGKAVPPAKAKEETEDKG